MPVEQERRRRIVFVQPNSEVGGSDIALLRMITALDRDRFDAVVVLPGDGPLVQLLRDAGAGIRLLPMMQLRTLPSLSYQTRYLARFWPTVWALRRVIRDEQADLVYTNSLYALYGGFAARAAGCPHLWHVREIPPAVPIGRPALARLVLALSRRVVSMTEACSVGLFGPVGARDGRIRILPEGLDLNVWARAQHAGRDIRAELGIARDALVAGFVARLDPWKGLDVFLEAASLVAARFPQAVFLVSGDAPAGFEAYRDRMVAKAAALGLGDRLRFLGWRYRLGDIPALMASFDVFCHASVRPEPFGLVLIEAMAMGCPVIAADAGGPIEITERGTSGMLTPPGDAASLGEAIATLFGDPARRRALAEAGRARVEAQYSLTGFGERLNALFDDALSGPGGRS